MIIVANCISSLGAHVIHLPYVLGICDIISIRSWEDVILIVVLTICTLWQQVYVGCRHMYWALHMPNTCLIRIALSVVRLLIEPLEAF